MMSNIKSNLSVESVDSTVDLTEDSNLSIGSSLNNFSDATDNDSLITNSTNSSDMSESLISYFMDEIKSINSNSFELSDESSVVSEFSDITELYSDYDTSDLESLNDSMTDVENGYTSSLSESETTIPTEYMTAENQKKIIPMVIGKISITLKGKKE